jgi:hypothetical protein
VDEPVDIEDELELDKRLAEEVVVLVEDNKLLDEDVENSWEVDDSAEEELDEPPIGPIDALFDVVITLVKLVESVVGVELANVEETELELPLTNDRLVEVIVELTLLLLLLDVLLDIEIELVEVDGVEAEMGPPVLLLYPDELDEDIPVLLELTRDSEVDVMVVEAADRV